MSPTEAISFLVYSFANAGMFVFMARFFFHHKHYSHFLKLFGCLVLVIASLLNFFSEGFTPLTFKLFALAHIAVSLGIALDKHSMPLARFLIPLLFIIPYFWQGHALLLALSTVTSINTVQLAYAVKHKRAIPLIGSTVLVVMAEYFYVYTESAVFAVTPDTSALLYIFASLIMIAWLLFYLLYGTYQALRSS